MEVKGEEGKAGSGCWSEAWKGLGAGGGIGGGRKSSSINEVEMRPEEGRK